MPRMHFVANFDGVTSRAEPFRTGGVAGGGSPGPNNQILVALANAGVSADMIGLPRPNLTRPLFIRKIGIDKSSVVQVTINIQPNGGVLTSVLRTTRAENTFDPALVLPATWTIIISGLGRITGYVDWDQWVL